MKNKKNIYKGPAEQEFDRRLQRRLATIRRWVEENSALKVRDIRVVFDYEPSWTDYRPVRVYHKKGLE